MLMSISMCLSAAVFCADINWDFVTKDVSAGLKVKYLVKVQKAFKFCDGTVSGVQPQNLMVLGVIRGIVTFCGSFVAGYFVKFTLHWLPCISTVAGFDLCCSRTAGSEISTKCLRCSLVHHRNPSSSPLSSYCQGVIGKVSGLYE